MWKLKLERVFSIQVISLFLKWQKASADDEPCLSASQVHFMDLLSSKPSENKHTFSVRSLWCALFSSFKAI